MCSFGLFCISLVGWIETLGELSQIVRAQILVCDTHVTTTVFSLEEFHQRVVWAYAENFFVNSKYL